MTDWQLIETAPKDGKHFLGAKNLGDGCGWMQYICCFYDFSGVHPSKLEKFAFKKSFGAFFGFGIGGVWYPLDEKNTPSHWMPLPASPEPPK